ncbi:MAG: LamG domain-containing protein [Chitinophagaceae bacterium]|nr:LamG domain-containing protein [Chitinophagaceae bacterium]
MTKNFQKLLLVISVLTLIASCQKMKKPGLGDYPVDANVPGGPLKFYTAFDGATTDALMNAVDSIRATFASDNPFTSVAGISGKAVQGVNKKFIKYAKPNDWAVTAKSFTIAYWYKKNGQTTNNTGTNGPEYPLSFKSSNGHWSGANLFIIMEGNNAACAIKVEVVDKTGADNWFTWEGGNTIAGLLDNNWHHIALVYSAATSGMTLYVDGIANAIVPKWGTHGDINIDDSKISEMRIGCGPGTGYDTDDWLSSSWKGSLDQFRMYNTALTGAEVMVLVTGKK